MNNVSSPRGSPKAASKKPRGKQEMQKVETLSKLSKAQQLFQSLVKYDTPYLVSTTINNKKARKELEKDEEKENELLKKIFYGSGGSESDDYSVKDALNIILPPKKINVNEQLWVQYVSCTPVTKAEVQNLKEGLDKRIKTLNAKETGICTTREALYSECFDELIRQVTINCLERGILMMLVKTEYEDEIRMYQNLYQSSIAYGIRSFLIVENEKKNMKNDIENIDEECEELTSQIEKLEKEIEETKKKDDEQRAMLDEKHKQYVNINSEKIELLKNDIKNRWEILSKQQSNQ